MSYYQTLKSAKNKKATMAILRRATKNQPRNRKALEKVWREMLEGVVDKVSRNYT